jgi:hypothetical protein
MRTIDKIITEVSCKYGAPMGRNDVGQKPKEILPDMSDMENIKDTYHYNAIWIMRKKQLNKKVKRIFDCRVPLPYDGAYDKGGVYWGCGAELRVQYTKDLTYIHFYRLGDR